MTLRSAVAFVAVAAYLLSAATAVAWNEGGTVSDPTGYGCDWNNNLPYATCHEPWNNHNLTGLGATTRACQACHTVHDATGDEKLLPRSTIKDSCFVCHDGSGGSGVYGTIQARGLTVGAQHRIDVTRLVPGGDPSGEATLAVFSGENQNLTCTDCHSAHNRDTVTTFWGDRIRTTLFTSGPRQGTRLLRKRPTGATTSTPEYGADWCAACHKGRSSAGKMFRHPVESQATTSNYYYYRRLAVVWDPLGVTNANTAPTTTVALGELGRGNRGFLMRVPRAPLQQGHAPLCQQCHEDTRVTVGSLSADGLAADPETYTADHDGRGTYAGGNPLFQNFPHETQNTRMLVEPGDDLCTNCHSQPQLP